jgi:hypothetical protein
MDFSDISEAKGGFNPKATAIGFTKKNPGFYKPMQNGTESSISSISAAELDDP